MLRPSLQNTCEIEIIDGQAAYTYIDFQATSIACSCSVLESGKAATSTLRDEVFPAIAQTPLFRKLSII